MTTHIGVDFIPPDVPGKVTGEIKYAEDYKREGMVFARLLTSPMPSGRVINIDASEALRMDGVVGVFTADDLPPTAPPGNPSLASNYVTYVGQPILAVAAVTEEIAESAIDRIKIDCGRSAGESDSWWQQRLPRRQRVGSNPRGGSGRHTHHWRRDQGHQMATVSDRCDSRW